MGREIDISRVIQAPPAIVWELLEKPPTWTTWWKECEHCHPMDHRALREGSQLEVVLRPDYKARTFTPVIDLFTENKTLSLTHRSPFVQATAVFYLAEKRDGSTQLRIQAVVEGVGMLILRLLGRGDLPLHVLDSALRGLKRTAERLV